MGWWTTTFNSYVHASLAFFDRHVGSLATCSMRWLESYPAHRPDNVVVVEGVHLAEVLQEELYFNVCVFC